MNNKNLVGEGTTDNPYLIGSYDDWCSFYDECATNPSICGKLTADINMTGKKWNPVKDFIYTGILDGDTHIISNFSTSAGLFNNTGGPP